MSGLLGRADGDHNRERRAFRASVVAIFGFTLLLPVAAQAGTYPNSMAATGDSITRAYNTGTFPYTDNPGASWSTGTNSTVESHYSRLLALHASIRGKNFNDAKSGAKMADLNGQMSSVVSQRVGYVIAAMVVSWVLAVVLALAPHPLYPFYAHEASRPGGISALTCRCGWQRSCRTS